MVPHWIYNVTKYEIYVIYFEIVQRYKIKCLNFQVSPINCQSVITQPVSMNSLCINCFGACVWYL